MKILINCYAGFERLERRREKEKARAEERTSWGHVTRLSTITFLKIATQKMLVLGTVLISQSDRSFMITS